MKIFISIILTFSFYWSSPNLGIARDFEYLCKCQSYYFGGSNEEEEGPRPCGERNPMELTFYLENKGEEDWHLMTTYYNTSLDMTVTGNENGYIFYGEHPHSEVDGFWAQTSFTKLPPLSCEENSINMKFTDSHDDWYGIAKFECQKINP